MGLMNRREWNNKNGIGVPEIMGMRLMMMNREKEIVRME